MIRREVNPPRLPLPPSASSGSLSAAARPLRQRWAPLGLTSGHNANAAVAPPRRPVFPIVDTLSRASTTPVSAPAVGKVSSLANRPRPSQLQQAQRPSRPHHRRHPLHAAIPSMHDPTVEMELVEADDHSDDQQRLRAANVSPFFSGQKVDLDPLDRATSAATTTGHPTSRPLPPPLHLDDDFATRGLFRSSSWQDLSLYATSTLLPPTATSTAMTAGTTMTKVLPPPNDPVGGLEPLDLMTGLLGDPDDETNSGMGGEFGAPGSAYPLQTPTATSGSAASSMFGESGVNPFKHGPSALSPTTHDKKILVTDSDLKLFSSPAMPRTPSAMVMGRSGRRPETHPGRRGQRGAIAQVAPPSRGHSSVRHRIDPRALGGYDPEVLYRQDRVRREQLFPQEPEAFAPVMRGAPRGSQRFHPIHQPMSTPRGPRKPARSSRRDVPTVAAVAPEPQHLHRLAEVAFLGSTSARMDGEQRRTRFCEPWLSAQTTMAPGRRSMGPPRQSALPWPGACSMDNAVGAPPSRGKKRKSPRLPQLFRFPVIPSTSLVSPLPPTQQHQHQQQQRAPLAKRKIGIYTPEARRERLERFHAKRKERVFHRRVKYACRKRLAIACPRLKGRFVSREEYDEAMARAVAETEPEPTATLNRDRGPIIGQEGGSIEAPTTTTATTPLPAIEAC